ncbi:HET-domain-containing protein, partial [Dendrothele bispora CBS 962.96]
MYLLDTSRLHLSEFPGNQIPPYAILSHTWGEGEITFQDIRSPESDATRKKAAFRKLRGCCNLARQHGFQWVWIDTCCINKDSSAELSEAINSMYRYYQDAEVCYAYLPDVIRNENPRYVNSSFRKCRWFTRGWTLQELLASSTVIFMDVDWVEIGTKSSLQDVITAVTGIPAEVLLDDDPQNISIATKMSWAAMRETTREEDRAYCLMGIFGVHMPTLYGEGLSNAFMRLQLEIIKSSRDRSIFAWRAPVGSSEERGLLAKSPFEFRTCRDVGVSDESRGISPYSMTNHGLCIQLPM